MHEVVIEGRDLYYLKGFLAKVDDGDSITVLTDNHGRMTLNINGSVSKAIGKPSENHNMFHGKGKTNEHSEIPSVSPEQDKRTLEERVENLESWRKSVEGLLVS